MFKIEYIISVHPTIHLQKCQVINIDKIKYLDYKIIYCDTSIKKYRNVFLKNIKG